MRSQSGLFVLALAVFASGCASDAAFRGGDQSAVKENGFLQGLANASAPMRRSWQRITETKEPPAITRWDWASGVPTGAPRADLCAASVSPDAVAYFLPELKRDGVQLVSMSGRTAAFHIVNVDGHPIRNCADLNLALVEAIDAEKDIQVDLTVADGRAASTTVAAMVDQPTLLSLTHAVADDQPVMRVAEDGNLWLWIRDGGVRGKLMVRVERERGLLQVVLSVANCWGNQELLPVEVRAACDEEPLRCLSAADTLEVLYGEGIDTEGDAYDEASVSFAEVSEGDDYLIPTNYKRLYEQSVANVGKTAAPVARPALASLPGVAYPGPAILGDARALTGVLLQRQLYEPRDPERSGWILYAGPTLSGGSVVDISLDLGSGPKTYRFQIPAS